LLWRYCWRALACHCRGRWLTETTQLGDVFVRAWTILQWPLVFAIVSAAIAIVYYFAPDVGQDWCGSHPGQSSQPFSRRLKDSRTSATEHA